MAATHAGGNPADIDSTYAWTRLHRVVLSTIGGVGMWSVVVALPAVQAEFGIRRAAGPRLPYTMTMLGFARRRRDGPARGPARDRASGDLRHGAAGRRILRGGLRAELWEFALAHLI